MFKIVITETKNTIQKVRDFAPTGEKDKDGTPAYAYTPYYRKKVERTVEVFKQEVESLDLAATIKIINNL
jgi:hypothetical protein